MPGVARATITLENEQLKLLERVCRLLAERARRDAEGARGTTMERIQRDAQAAFEQLADRLNAARAEPDPDPPPASVRPIRR